MRCRFLNEMTENLSPLQTGWSGLISLRSNSSRRRYFTRRPLKNPALVVFCLMLAVSPCSAEF
jgi:hypothetical protein